MHPAERNRIRQAARVGEQTPHRHLGAVRDRWNVAVDGVIQPDVAPSINRNTATAVIVLVIE